MWLFVPIARASKGFQQAWGGSSIKELTKFKKSKFTVVILLGLQVNGLLFWHRSTAKLPTGLHPFPQEKCSLAIFFLRWWVPGTTVTLGTCLFLLHTNLMTVAIWHEKCCLQVWDYRETHIPNVKETPSPPISRWSCCLCFCHLRMSCLNEGLPFRVSASLQPEKILLLQLLHFSVTSWRSAYKLELYPE